MALFKYNGDHEIMIAYGYDFSNGPTEVPVTDKLAFRKLSGNSHFDLVEEDINEIVQVMAPGVPEEKKKDEPNVEYALCKKGSKRAMKVCETEQELIDWAIAKKKNPDDCVIIRRDKKVK